MLLGNSELSSGPDGIASSGTRWKLPLAQRERLRVALDSKGTLDMVTPEQRSAIREICENSEIRNVRPEHFVIGVKAALLSVVDELGLPPGPTRNEAVGRLLTVCIQQFYEVSSRADGPERADGEG